MRAGIRAAATGRRACGADAEAGKRHLRAGRYQAHAAADRDQNQHADDAGRDGAVLWVGLPAMLEPIGDRIEPGDAASSSHTLAVAPPLYASYIYASSRTTDPCGPSGAPAPAIVAAAVGDAQFRRGGWYFFAGAAYSARVARPRHLTLSAASSFGCYARSARMWAEVRRSYARARACRRGGIHNRASRTPVGR